MSTTGSQTTGPGIVPGPDQPAEHAGRPGGILPASLTRDPDALPDHLTGLGDGEIMRRGHLRVLRGEKED